MATPESVRGEVICWPGVMLLTEIPMFLISSSSSGPVAGWLVTLVLFTCGLADAVDSGKLFFGGVGKFAVVKSALGATCA